MVDALRHALQQLRVRQVDLQVLPHVRCGGDGVAVNAEEQFVSACVDGPQRHVVDTAWRDCRQPKQLVAFLSHEVDFDRDAEVVAHLQRDKVCSFLILMEHRR